MIRAWENPGAPVSSKAAPQEREIEIWGGVEYTCNRVGDRYFDQTELSGHARRPSDYQLIADLGIRTLRAGLVWERHASDPTWRRRDEHLACMRGLGIRPIAGLVHHGSGPAHTDLLDPMFPEKLAAYARQVAERYPWIESYTPVNECNTTARFSGMYGVWYPHESSKQSYLRALWNQLKAVVLSMRAIRVVNPAAQLVQTEDLGRFCGTESLRSTWELMNLRQWLPYDLLCGLVDRYHPMFSYLQHAGISEQEIYWFRDNPCPPDTLGINYYVTSDRFLDHRLAHYPEDRRSAEGPFVDVEAVRVDAPGIQGFASLLQEAWKRYRIPVAVTEVHLGCSTDEQIRWLAEAWDGIRVARHAGVECIGMTAWALLGSFYWNQLVTSDNGHYEPGCFDVRSGTPVQTELASVVRQLAAGHAPQHPALSRSGWWRQQSRVLYTNAEDERQAEAERSPELIAAA